MAKLINGTITLYPTKTIISPYTERNPLLENSLNVWDKVNFDYKFQAFIRDVDSEENDRIILPTGFAPNYLLNMYPTYNLVDKRSSYEKYMEANRSKYKINMKYDCRNDIQRNALKFLNTKELRHRYRPMQRYLCLSTGVGKTFVTVKYIADNHERPIIFVDQETLGKQWIERIKEYTDTTDKEIYYISGRTSVNKIFKMSTDDILKIKFFICSYRTITNIILNDNNTNKIAELFTTMKVTLKVFDEAHVEYMSIFKMDMISNLRSIYLSATPMRSDPIEDKVYQNMFRQVERFYSKDKDDKTVNYHNILILKWDSKPSLLDQSYCLMKYGFSMAKYCDYILREGVYNKFENLMYAIIFDTVLANRKKKKTAILFGTLKLLNVFYDNLTKYCEEKGFKLVINKFSGETKKEDRLDVLDQADIILTTDKSFGKAIDVKGLQVLINTVPFTSESKLTQTIGRLREIPNKEVTFIDINDIGFLPIRNHISIKKSKVYKHIAKNLFEKSI